MAKKKSTGVGQIIPERIMDWSGGQNNAVNVALLNENESRLLENYSLDEKGTLFPFPGSLKRYAADLGSSPVSGMGKLYKSDGTSKFLIGLEDGKLYVDSPHLINQYDTQAEFNGGSNFAVQADAGGKLWPMIIQDGFESGLFDDWHTHDSGWTIDSTVYKTGAKSAKGTEANKLLVRSFGFNAKHLKITLYVRFGEITRDHYISFFTSTNTVCYPVVAYSDGHFKYFNGTTYANYPTDKTYVANTWYKIEIFIRNGYAWIGIDGVCLTTEGIALKDGSNNAVTDLSSLRIATDVDDTDSNTWLDDVEVNLLSPVFSRGSVAYKQDGTQVVANAPRFETVGSVQGVMVEEGTTPLIQNSFFSNFTGTKDDNTGDTFTSWSQYADGTGRVEAVSDGAFGATAIKAVMTDAPGPAYRGVYQSRTLAAMGLVVGDVVSLQARYKMSAQVSAGARILALFFDSGGSVIGLVWLLNDATAAVSNYTVTKAENVTIPTGTVSISFETYIRASAALSGQNNWLQVDFFCCEKKGYCISPTDVSQSAETLTVPTAGVFNKGGWTVELNYRCLLENTVESRMLWFFYIDANNRYYLYTYNGKFRVFIMSNGVFYGITDPLDCIKDVDYSIMLSGGDNLLLCINGQQYGLIQGFSDTLSTLPTLMYIGSDSGLGRHADGIISNIRFSSRARTLAEHQAYVSSGQPIPLDNDTTLLMLANGNLNISTTHHWISPAIDCSNATDQTSGHASLTSLTPGGSNVTVYSRSAPASTGPWTAWAAALGDGSLQHAADDYVQIKLILARDGENDPYVDKLTVSFDGQATATLLASDFSPGKQFFFDQLNDLLAVMTGDAPRKYDGTTLAAMGGSPPHAPYGVAHKNRFWMAKGSRLYFSDLLNIESWPVLNFIDIMPNDGDEITGMITFGDYLVIAKGHSVWLLIGETINTFRVRRIHSDRGCYAPRSLCIVNQMLCFVSDDGIYFSDFTQPVLISERIRKTWDGLNKRRLNLVASWFFDHKLYVAVPDAGQQRNTRVIVYDSLRQAFAGDKKWPVSCWTDFREAGEINTFFGRSDLGNVRKINTGYNDDGEAYEAVYESMAISHGAAEILKRYNIGYLQIKPAALDAELIISFIVDGVETPTMTVSVPANATGLIDTLQIFASEVGVISGHRIQVKIRQQVLDNPLGIQSVYLEALPLLIAPTLRG